MQVFFSLAYFVIGLVQLFAIIDGVSYAFGVGGVLAFIIGIVTTYIPLLGAGLGVYGAIKVWDWSFIQAGLLFFWYIPAFAAMMIFTRR